MKNIHIRSAYILMLLLFLFPSKYAYGQAKKKVESKEVAPGIIHTKIVDPADTLIINILKINLNNKSYDIEAVKAKDLFYAREKATAESARLTNSRQKVIAAVNADFFKIETGGEVINNMITDGKFVKAFYKKKGRIRPQFVITFSGKPLIGYYNFNGKLFLKDGSSDRINRVNGETDSAGITLYNSYQGKKTPSVKKNGTIFEIKLKDAGTSGDTLFLVAEGISSSSGSTEIPDDGYVLSSSYSAVEKLSKEISAGDTLKALLRLTPYYGPIRTLTGGLPLIVKDGINLAAESDTLEGMHKPFTVVKHPRTGVGISKDSTELYLITVDGRQESSSGMSLKEFGNLMIKEGIYQGLNLDGGGSTTMVINGKLVNNPSDKSGERPVGNCLLVIEKNKD